jgi:hypothetical protein
MLDWMELLLYLFGGKFPKLVLTMTASLQAIGSLAS